jgi:hypothetical protein
MEVASVDDPDLGPSDLAVEDLEDLVLVLDLALAVAARRLLDLAAVVAAVTTVLAVLSMETSVVR